MVQQLGSVGDWIGGARKKYDSLREADLRKQGYMPHSEIPYPTDGNYTEIVSVVGYTSTRTMHANGTKFFHQSYSNLLPQRVWFALPQGFRFFWDNIGDGAQISMLYPNEKEERTVVRPGGHCDNPGLFEDYKAAKQPMQYMLQTMATIFIGVPSVSTAAGRRGWVQVVAWPKRANSHLLATGEAEWPKGVKVRNVSSRRYNSWAGRRFEAA